MHTHKLFAVSFHMFWHHFAKDCYNCVYDWPRASELTFRIALFSIAIIWTILCRKTANTKLKTTLQESNARDRDERGIELPIIVIKLSVG